MVVQCFSYEGYKEHIDNSESHQAAYNDPAQKRFTSTAVHHFGITEPFTGRTAKNALEKSIVHEYHPRKEPPEIIERVSPVPHIPVPAFSGKMRKRENDKGIYKEIQNPGAVANLLHGAKEFENLKI
jgi:hypothetical protein